MRRPLIMTLVALVLVVVAAQRWPEPGPRTAPPGPFGVMLDAKELDIDARVDLAEHLEARYFRSTAVLLPVWDGGCPECEAVHRAGLQWVLTLRNSRSVTTAARPLDDVDAFKRTVGRVLDRYEPSLVVVENEENTAKFFDGTADDYLEELTAACQVAHQRHLPCTNGGLLSGTVAWVVYFHYIDSGDVAAAASFADRALTAPARTLLKTSAGEAEARAAAERALQLLEGYGPAGADYLNIHWYIADGPALDEAVAYLRAVSGLRVISNEMGQRDIDPDVTTALLRTAQRLDLPIVVWFSVDARLARSLVEPGGALRVTGEAFRAYVATHHTEPG